MSGETPLSEGRQPSGPGTTPSVDVLLLPGTPPSVATRYRSLAERAKHAELGLLGEDFVVLDTETTGLSFRDCELIEIAAARIRGGVVEERFQTFVHPMGPIPPEISALTHISDLDVTDAPSAVDAVAALSEFVAGDPVLAHNATFDRTFVESVPGGRDVSGNWIDTLALSRIALPRLSSHRLADMARAFGCDSATHRATADVEALAGMWRIMLVALMDLPPGLLDLLSTMHEEVDWQLRPILSYLAHEASDEGASERGAEVAPFSLKLARRGLVSEGQGHVRDDAAEKDEPLSAPTRLEVEEAFSADGIVGSLYAHFEVRPDQVQMAREVRDALASSTHRSIEAGTGVGKSMAYLLPEVLFAQRNDLTVGIATKTNALTDQLVTHELPILDSALPQGLRFTSLKGYEHYPCLHRLERAALGELPTVLVEGESRSLAAMEADMLTAIAVTYAFCCQSPEGDLDALGIRWRYVPRMMLTTTPAECLRGSCPYYPNECLVHGARRRAACSDVVVTNHSLLLRDVEMDGRILPPVRHWVVDEAHAFEAEARRQWAVEVSGDEARQAFELLGGTKSGALHNLMVQTAGLEGAALIQRLLTKAAAAVARAAASTSDLFLALHSLGCLASGGGGYESTTLWIDGGVRLTPEWDALSEAAHVALARLEEASKDMDETAEKISESSPQLGANLIEAGGFLHALHDGIYLIVSGEDESYVYSAQLSRRRRDIGSERLLAEKFDVGADLGSRWLPEMMSVVFASATMAVGESFEHFDHSVGLDVLGGSLHKDVRLSSSFDYRGNMAVIVAQDMPQPNDPRYLSALEDLLFDVHRSMGGSVLTLFTNRRDMERVYAGLQPRLSQLGLPVICQERGSSARRLRERFMADRSCSLLALRSFWEGFDSPGDTLRCVVIPKLPFASPCDPLVRERELREERAWWRHSLPEAVISVKQAAGRLIRSSSDAGVLVLADSRLVSKRYGRQFTSSLPNPDCTRLKRSNVSRYIGLWRSSHE